MPLVASSGTIAADDGANECRSETNFDRRPKLGARSKNDDEGGGGDGGELRAREARLPQGRFFAAYS